MPRTIEFELHHGYEDQNEDVHKTVIMRAVKNADIIATSKDQRIKQLLKDDYAIDMRAAMMLSQGGDAMTAAALSGISIDPIKMQAAQGAIAELYGIIFAKVVLSIGTITKKDINTKTFADLSPTDFAIIQKYYTELNEVDEKLLKGDAPESDPSQQEESAK